MHYSDLLWELLKAVTPQGMDNLVVQKRLIHKKIARNPFRMESYQLLSVMGCQLYLNKAGNVIEYGRKGSRIGGTRPVSGHESVFSWVTLSKILHLFEHPFTCSMDSCIHSGNT